MPIQARYAHTNIVTRDWRRLADFYINVFGCEPVSSQRNHHGEWVTRLTNVADARIIGQHLRMPGFEGDDAVAPTLEIFEYNHADEAIQPTINRPGLAHLAFEVDDVAAARQAVLAAGGRDYGEQQTVKVPGAGTITLIYMTDPDGNILELQKWDRATPGT